MDEKTLVPLFEGPLEEFPSAQALPEGVKVLQLEDTFGYDFHMIPGVIYAKRTGEEQKMHILLPRDRDNPELEFPLVVFIQGSAFHRQEIFQHLPHMIRVCQKGFAVALVEYRPSDIAPFPAQMQDAKTAIRFLRKHAKQYHIDSSRIALWGDSSGGHTAVIAGITGDRQPDSDLYGEYSCQVRCIVDWYGPMDIAKMNYVPSTQDHIQPDSPEGYLIGQKNVLENPHLVEPTIPMNYLSRDVETPPVLIMHGSKDQIVNFEQGCMLYSALKELGKEVEMYKLEGAYHAFGGFNCEQILDISVDFIRKHLK